jgi:hypothetical protein
LIISVLSRAAQEYLVHRLLRIDEVLKIAFPLRYVYLAEGGDGCIIQGV